MEHYNLNNGNIFILAEAAGGIYNSEQLRILCDVADEAFLKISEDMRVGLMIDPSKIGEITAQLAKAGLLVRPYQKASGPSPKACLGELCPHMEQDALGDSMNLNSHFSTVFNSGKPLATIGINGCAKACVGSAVDDIHIVGDSEGYKIYLGGKSSELPSLAQYFTENVSKDILPQVLEKLLEVFYSHQTGDERFYDVLERVGMSAFHEACKGLTSTTLEHLEAEDVPMETKTEDETEELIISTNHLTDKLEQTDLTELNIPMDDLDLEPMDQGLETPAPESTEDKMGEIPETVIIHDDSPMEEELDVVEKPSYLKPFQTSEFSDEGQIKESDVSRLLAEVDNMEMEEATSSDMDKMTRTMRLEAQHDEEARTIVAAKNTVYTGLSNATFSHAASIIESKSQQKFKIKMVGDELKLTLPNGFECAVPLSFIQEGCAFEIDVEGEALMLERFENMVSLRYGLVSMNFPIPNSRAA